MHYRSTYTCCRLAGWPGLSITGTAPAVVVVAVLALQSTYILATGLDMNCRVDSEQGARGNPQDLLAFDFHDARDSTATSMAGGRGP